MSNSSADSKKEVIKQTKIFTYSTLVAQATILIPLAAELTLKYFKPEITDLSTLNRVVYPITAALSGAYVTWRVYCECSVFKNEISSRDEKIRKLEITHERKKEEHNLLIVNGMLEIIKDVDSKETKDRLCDLLKEMSSNKLLNCTLQSALEMVELAGGFNDISINSPSDPAAQDTQSAQNKRKNIDRRDNVEIGDNINNITF